MKLKSLLLGSAAALALTSGALAADPRSSFVSLDVCDAYGISGLTIASADTCLKISGSVTYDFQWGNYTNAVGGTAGAPGAANAAAAAIPLWAGGTAARNVGNWGDAPGLNDWRTRLETILRFEATTQTDAGAAKATIVFRDRDYLETFGNAPSVAATVPAGAFEHTGGDRHPLRIEEAWVSFGDTTVLMAGKKGSIAKLGNDEPFNYLGLANASRVDTGVLWSAGANTNLRRGGHVIQIVSEVADGVSVGAGLESLDGTAANSRGTFVGFVEAKGAWGNAHATVVMGDVLDNTAAANPWGFHAGATFNFDNFKVRGALATDQTGYWNALLSGEAAFDMFTIAASAEFINTAAAVNELGLGASVGFQATETVKINAGFRYYDPNTAVAGGEGWQAALQVVANVAEGIDVTGAVGAYGGGTLPAANDPLAYVELGVAYKPGGGFETGVGVEANAQGAYKLKFNAKKTF